MNGPRCGSGDGEQKEDPHLEAKDSPVSEDKGEAEGASNWSDSSVK